MESNPLHPFELHSYVPLSLFGLDISLNKAVIMMWVVIALASWLLYMAGRQRRLVPTRLRSEEHTSELQSHSDLVCRLLLEKKKRDRRQHTDLDQVAGR